MKPITSVRELRKYVADCISEGEQLLDILGDEGDLAEHVLILHWVLPQAKITLEGLRANKPISWDSPKMLPVHTILILNDHVRYIMEEAMDNMSDDEYERMLEEYGDDE